MSKREFGRWLMPTALSGLTVLMTIGGCLPGFGGGEEEEEVRRVPGQCVPGGDGCDVANDCGGSSDVQGCQSDAGSGPMPPDGEVDLLWVIDNTGSMCQEQAALRESFRAFAGKIAAADIDFHIAVTTTHLKENYTAEPVAKPGQIQSTPQPIPGADISCQQGIDDNGEPVDGDWTPIRDNIEAAVACTRNPTQWQHLTQVSDEDIECAIKHQPAGCGMEPADLFPPSNAYRSIPKVLKASDYEQSDGTINVDLLASDFACMSMVGTRGYGIERGLQAAVEAVSPEKTSGPNAGFLRKNAGFGLFVVTDDNDCSHDGSLDEQHSCQDQVCEFANKAGQQNSPLLETSELAGDFVDNLSASKGRQVSADELFVASILGTPQRYDGPTPDTCEQGERYISPVCNSALGSAYSGDRYARFMKNFGHYYPGDADTVQGWMCENSFHSALEAIGDSLAMQ